MSISIEQYYRGIVPVSIDRSNFSVKLNYNATLTTTSGQLGINLGTANTWTAQQTFNNYLIVGASQTSENNSKLQIFSSNNGYGQIQIGNATANDEASMSFSNGVTGFTTGQPSISSTGAIWDIGISNWGNGTYFGIGNNIANGKVWTFETNGALTGVRNTLDDGSGNMSIAGNLSVTGTGGIFATANTWSALQTFGNNISIGGATLDVSSLASGDVLYYNGTNWINEALGQFGVSGISGNTTAYLVGNVELKSGSGISISQSSPDITIGNTGVLSLQGDTGALNLTANSGISISGLGIGIDFGGAYTWTAEQLSTYGFGVTGTSNPYSQYGNVGIYLGASNINSNNANPSLTLLRDDSGTIGVQLSESFNTGFIAFINGTTSYYDLIFLDNYVATSGSSNTTVGSWSQPSARNVLDDGSGNITVNGQYLNLNYGGNGGAVLFGGTTVQNRNSKAGGASFSGRPRIGDWGQWLTIGEPNGTANGSIIQIEGGDQYVGIGTSSGITDAPTIHTKFATNTGGLTYYQGLSGAGWGLSQIIDVASATGYTGTGGATLLSVSYGSNFALRASAFYYLNSFASGATMPNITFGTTDWTGNGYTATVITGNNVGDDTFATASAVLACKSGDSVVIAIGTGSGTYNLDYFVMLERVY